MFDAVIEARWASALMAAGSTAFHAAIGVIVALIAAIGVDYLRGRLPVVDLLYRPVLLAAFCVPAFALSGFAASAGLPGGYIWLLVAFTLVIPLETAVMLGRCEADLFDRGSPGRAARRFWLVRLPAMTPAILLGVAAAIPWALLGTMLIEMNEGEPALGIRLVVEAQNGIEAQFPLAAIAVLGSGGLYLLFWCLSHYVRAALGLDRATPRRSLDPPGNLEFGPAAMLWGTALTALVWTAMASKDPVVVSAPWDLDPMRRVGGLLLVQLLQTVLSGLAALLAGGLLGLVIVLLSTRWASLGYALSALLLPLQIIPLHVFAVPLIALTLLLNGPGGLDPPRRLIVDGPVILIATLSAAYIVIHSMTSWAKLLPGRTSGLLTGRPPLDRQVVRHVSLPWLLRGLGAYLPVLVPRTFLAVFVTEYLITKHGLGGALTFARAQRDFQGTFLIVILIILAALLLQMLVTLHNRRIMAEITG